MHHGSGGSVTVSVSVLTDPTTFGMLNSDLTSCPRTAPVLGGLAAQWRQMMGTLQRVGQEAVSSQNLDNAIENMGEDTDRRDRKPIGRSVFCIWPSVGDGSGQCDGRCSKVHSFERQLSGVKSLIRGMRSGWWLFAQVIQRPSYSGTRWSCDNKNKQGCNAIVGEG